MEQNNERLPDVIEKELFVKEISGTVNSSEVEESDQDCTLEAMAGRKLTKREKSVPTAANKGRTLQPRMETRNTIRAGTCHMTWTSSVEVDALTDLNMVGSEQTHVPGCGNVEGGTRDGKIGCSMQHGSSTHVTQSQVDAEAPKDSPHDVEYADVKHASVEHAPEHVVEHAPEHVVEHASEHVVEHARILEHGNMEHAGVEHADMEHVEKPASVERVVEHLLEHADSPHDVEYADVKHASVEHVVNHADVEHAVEHVVEHAHILEHGSMEHVDVEHADMVHVEKPASVESVVEYADMEHVVAHADVVDHVHEKMHDDVEHSIKQGPGYRYWEVPEHPLFENKPALILDLNGLLLTTVNRGRGEIVPSYVKLMKNCLWDLKGVDLAVKADAKTFLDWCFQCFDVFVWTCCRIEKANKLLKACFPNQHTMFKKRYSQNDCHEEERFTVNGLRGGKPVFYKRLVSFWEDQPAYTRTNTLLIDNSEYKCVWNPPGTLLIVKKLAEQKTVEMLTYLTEDVCKWLEKWLVVKDRLLFTIEHQLDRSPHKESLRVIGYWKMHCADQ